MRRATPSSLLLISRHQRALAWRLLRDIRSRLQHTRLRLSRCSSGSRSASSSLGRACNASSPLSRRRSRHCSICATAARAASPTGRDRQRRQFFRPYTTGPVFSRSLSSGCPAQSSRWLSKGRESATAPAVVKREIQDWLDLRSPGPTRWHPVDAVANRSMEQNICTSAWQ
jgi:hypothetical protein